MGNIDMDANVKSWQGNMMIPLFCQPVAKWFKEAADLTEFASAVRPGMRLLAQWVRPAIQMLDPQKEFKVLQDKVRSGMPLEDMLEALGYNNMSVTLGRKEKENIILDEMGLILDVDPRRVSGAGNAIEHDDDIDDPDGDTGSDNDDDLDDQGEPKSSRDDFDVDGFKSKVDAYGAAVRSGAINPQKEDEETFRSEAGLPAMGSEIEEAWGKEPTRRPVTLAQANTELDAQAGGGDDDDDNGDDDDQGGGSATE